jgi:hypothetical protein
MNWTLQNHQKRLKFRVWMYLIMEIIVQKEIIKDNFQKKKMLLRTEVFGRNCFAILLISFQIHMGTFIMNMQYNWIH